MSNVFTHKIRAVSLLLLGLLTVTACSTPLVPSVPGAAQTVTPSASEQLLSQLTLDTGRDVLVQIPSDRTASLQQLIPDLQVKSLAHSAHLYQLRLPAGRSLLNTLKLLNQTPGVSFAEANPSFKIPDFKIQAVESFRPRDPRYGMQWNMRSAKIDQAWTLVKSNPSILVAVIDSGVDPNHEDLVDHLEPLEDIYNELKGSDIYRNPFTSEVLNYIFFKIKSH